MKFEEMHRLFLSLVLIFVGAAVAVAHDVTIINSAKLGRSGPELRSGTYRVEVVKNQGSSEALFYKGRDLVVRIPAKLVQESTKSPQTALHSEIFDSGRVITQIRIAGWRETLVFEPPTQSPGTAQ